MPVVTEDGKPIEVDYRVGPHEQTRRAELFFAHTVDGGYLLTFFELNRRYVDSEQSGKARKTTPIKSLSADSVARIFVSEAGIVMLRDLIDKHLAKEAAKSEGKGESSDEPA